MLTFARRLLPLTLLLAACGLLPGPARPTARPSPGTALTATAAALTPLPSPTPGSDATLTPIDTPSGPVALRIWLPPDFTPDVSTRSGQMLAEQIQAFETAHPGTAVEVRTKAASGAGGLLNALTTAANAAPTVLPDVIALTRDDLAVAASAGLVAPLEALLPVESLADYYPYAQAMARVNGVWVGLPFAANARVLAYLSDVYASPPLRWTQVLTGPFVLPVGESTGFTVLDSYVASGGSLSDSTGKLHLDPEALAQTLEAYQRLLVAGLVPGYTLDYADASTTWQAFRERRATLAATDAGWFLSEFFRVVGANATLLPTGGEPPVALADGWTWAIVNTAPERHALAAELIVWLCAPENNGPWTEAAAVLPTRTASLATWKSPLLTAVAGNVVTHAQLQPPASVLAVVGPALQQALADVLNGRATPFAAATMAAATVNQP